MAFTIIAVKLCNLYIAVVLYNIKIKFMGIWLATKRQKCFGGLEFGAMKKRD